MLEKLKILLVEDDSMIVDMYKLRFEEEGYDVLVTDKGTEALEIAKKEQPAIILLDIILPEMDGFTILQELKKDIETKNIPVLMLTNLGQEGDQFKGKEQGAAEYFVKSKHTPAQIMEKIREITKPKRF